MSSQGNQREQAEKLLRAITDIDDRFLVEAMREEGELAAAGEGSDKTTETATLDAVSSAPETMGVGESNVSETAGTGTGDTSGADSSGKGDVSRTAGLGSGDTSLESGRGSGKKLRRYSTWALTAAACLAVIIIGRYVSVNNVKNSAIRPAKIAEEQSGAEQGSQETGQRNQEAVEGNQEAAPENKAAEREKSKDASDNAVVEIRDEDMAMEAVPDIAEEADADMEEAPRSGMAEEAVLSDMEGEEPVQSAGEVPMDFAAEAPAAEDLEEVSGQSAYSAGAGAMLGIPNPFIDAETLEEAEEAAGFSITLPTLDVSGDTVIYRAMKGEMIEVIYKDEYNREEYRIRKGLNMEDDISGVLYEYAETQTLETENGIKVTVYGEDAQGDSWGTAVWTQDAGEDTRYSYSIDNGRSVFTTKEVLTIVEEMTT